MASHSARRTAKAIRMANPGLLTSYATRASAAEGQDGQEEEA